MSPRIEPARGRFFKIARKAQHRFLTAGPSWDGDDVPNTASCRTCAGGCIGKRFDHANESPAGKTCRRYWARLPGQRRRKISVRLRIERHVVVDFHSPETRQILVTDKSIAIT